ncbi:hypothetical protein GQ42DRAFT_133209 [Ramicandelaber brevisporus]|nr:hypothetical protein GQ42DRAFT_133209 [Ramicandelaber brevisporus]
MLNHLVHTASTWVGYGSTALPALLSYPTVPGAVTIPLATLLHGLCVAFEVRKGIALQSKLNGGRRMHWRQELAIMLLFSFGGTILMGLMLGTPQMYLEQTHTVPVYALAYALLAFIPGDPVFKLMLRFSPITDVGLAVFGGLVRGYGITAAGVDAVRGMPGSISTSLTAMVVVGTTLGSGGGMIDDLIQFSKPNWGLRTPSMLIGAPIQDDIKKCFYTTLYYIYSTRAWSLTELLTTAGLKPGLVYIMKYPPPDLVINSTAMYLIYAAEKIDGVLSNFIPKLSVEDARFVCTAYTIWYLMSRAWFNSKPSSYYFGSVSATNASTTVDNSDSGSEKAKQDEKPVAKSTAVSKAADSEQEKPHQRKQQQSDQDATESKSDSFEEIDASSTNDDDGNGRSKSD